MSRRHHSICIEHIPLFPPCTGVMLNFLVSRLWRLTARRPLVHGWIWLVHHTGHTCVDAPGCTRWAAWPMSWWQRWWWFPVRNPFRYTRRVSNFSNLLAHLRGETTRNIRLNQKHTKKNNESGCHFYEIYCNLEYIYRVILRFDRTTPCRSRPDGMQIINVLFLPLQQSSVYLFYSKRHYQIAYLCISFRISFTQRYNRKLSDCKKRHIQLGQQSNRNYLRAGYFLGNIDT